MYIPTTFFSSQGSCFTVSTSTISGSSLITSGSFISGGVYWDYYKFETADFDDATLTALTASFTILSGSTNRAKVLVVGGGATGTDGASTSFRRNAGTFSFDVTTASGGGGGGVVYYDNFPLTTGTYEIGVANAVDGYILCGGCSNGTICSKPGNTSYIKLPNNLTYTPFTSSTILAYGGGGGSIQGGYLQLSPKTVFYRVVPEILSGSSALYASAGGASGTPSINLFPEGDRPSPANSQYSVITAGIGQGGINANNQGNNGGVWCGGSGVGGGDTFGGGSGGGGALNTPISLGQGCSGSGVYVSDGGDGLSFNLTGTSIIVGNGGGGANDNLNLQGIRGNSGANTYGSGGNGYYGVATTTKGNGGVVIIVIPRCSTAFDCKTFAISGSGNTVSYLECSNFAFTTSSTNIPYYDTLRVCLTTLSGSNTPLLLSGSYLSSTLISSCDSPSTTLIPTTYPRPFDTCSCLSYTITPRVNPITINRIQYCGSSTSGSSLTITSGSATTLCLVSSSVSLLSITGSSYNFDFNGNCVTSSCAPLNSLSVNYLIVGGGGAGGGDLGGGGGGGGYLEGVAYLNLSQSYNIVVGNGGTGSAGSVGGNGQDSSAFTFTAIGGGGGGETFSNRNGISGGSGGGGGYDLNGIGGAGTSGQGNNGGNGNSTNRDSGGGGGASGIGESGTSNSNGGIGRLWLDGNRYGAGGGGFRTETTLQAGNGVGGSVGAGQGAQATSLNVYLRANTSGSANTGGGGGGTGQPATGSMNGGSGIVKIRYVATASLATGGDISITGSFVYHTFTGSGTFTTL